MSEPIAILVVEDEAIIAMELESSLLKWGFTVVGTATDGAGALAMADANRVDLVIMDIRLNGKPDGIDLAGQLRSRFDVGVIYRTAFVDDELIERARATRPLGYLLKPSSENALRVCLEMALAKRRDEQELSHDRERLETTVAELQTALERVKLLSGLLPICAGCKKIRDDKDHWEQVEVYVRDHSEAEFTHSICPDCSMRLYGMDLE